MEKFLSEKCKLSFFAEYSNIFIQHNKLNILHMHLHLQRGFRRKSFYCLLLADNLLSELHLSRLEELCPLVCGDDMIPDELLFGRVGYLYSLLFVQKYLGKEKISHDNIVEVRMLP